MANIAFKTRRLSKYMAVEAEIDSIKVDLGVIGVAEAQAILAEVESLREDLVDYIENTKCTSENDYDYD